MNWDAITQELSKKLDPANVKPAKSFGPKGDYIEGWHAMAEANAIFGFGGWSYTIDLVRDSLNQGLDSKGGEQWQAAYTCICKVDVGGVIRQDVGFGSGFAKNIGDAIEGATKEAATDSLKRALRTFGNAFGLALYDKARTSVAAPPPDLVDAATRDLITEKAEAAGVSVQKICESYNVEHLRDLTAAQGGQALARLEATIKQKEK